MIGREEPFYELLKPHCLRLLELFLGVYLCVMGVGYLLDGSYRYGERGLLLSSGTALVISGIFVAWAALRSGGFSRRLSLSAMLLAVLLNAFRGIAHRSLLLTLVFSFLALTCVVIVAVEHANESRYRASDEQD